MFGGDALPYRVWVFLTQFANLVLLASITTRLTRSRAAGFWAAILWVANSKLATVMSWTCEYILVLCGFFLLVAMHFFLRYIETSERRYYLWTWVAFLCGFLAMETNVVFPLLIGSYALLCARKHFRATLPFFATSGAYAILHLILAPNHGTGPYTLHFDGALPATFWTYWRMSFEPLNLSSFTPFPAVAGTAMMAASTAALLGFAFYRARRGQWLPVVFLAWFAALLVPVLPLRDHIADYHLTLPTMSLAMLEAFALVCAWRAGVALRAMSTVLLAVFLVLSLPVAWRSADWFRQRSQAQQALVMGVARAHELHPGKTILLDGIGDDLFWGAMLHRPFLFLGITDVYLTPGSEAHITPHPDLGDVSTYVLPAGEALRGLENGDVVVYSAAHRPLRNITRQFEVPAGWVRTSGPLRIDVADPLVANRLGPGWYARESGFRWMSGAASVRMPGPRSAAQELYLTASCPAAQLEKGPLEMTLTVDHIPLAPVRFTKSNTETTFAFALPPECIGKTDIDIGVEVSRTVRVGNDQRDLGLAFGRFEIK